MAIRKNIAFKHLFLCGAAIIRHPLTFRQRIYGLIALLGRPFRHIPGIPYLRSLFYRAIGGHDYLNCDNENITETFKNMIECDLTEEIGNIHIPTTLIWGKLDTYTPIDDAYVLEKKIPNSH